MRLVELLLETTAKSLADLRRRVTNVRYGPPGLIYYDVDGVTYATPEPHDVMPVGQGDASIRWALKQHLANDDKLVVIQ